MAFTVHLCQGALYRAWPPGRDECYRRHRLREHIMHAVECMPVSDRVGPCFGLHVIYYYAYSYFSYA